LKAITNDESPPTTPTDLPLSAEIAAAPVLTATDAAPKKSDWTKLRNRSTGLFGDDETLESGICRRWTAPRLSAHATFDTFLDIKSSEGRIRYNPITALDSLLIGNGLKICDRRRRMSLDSVVESKARKEQDRRDQEAEIRRRALEIFTASEITETSSAAEISGIPQATFLEHTTNAEDIEEAFLKQQQKQQSDIAKAKEITRKVQNDKSLGHAPESIKEMRAAMQIIASANTYSSTLSDADLQSLHEIITMDVSAAEAATKPFNWGI
jgi:hypothetical protein